MPVQFKFRGEKSYRNLINLTTPCTLQRLHSAVYEQARLSEQSTDLLIEDSTTGAALNPNTLLVPNASIQVIVRRIPVLSRVLRPAVSAIEPSDDASQAEKSKEDLAIDKMVEKHDVNGVVPAPSAATLLRYSRSHRLASLGQERQRHGYDVGGSDDEAGNEEATEPPPANYTCHRCGTAGGNPDSHWIWECPTNEDPEHMKKVRTAKGVPREFLKKVASIEEGQKQSPGGVTFILPGHSGHYIIDHEATYEEKKLRVGDTVQEKVTTAFSIGARRVEDALRCPLCHQLFRQAVLAPCCGSTFCSDCVVDRLAHTSEDHGQCPGCRGEVLAHQLIPNIDIRILVDQVSRASKAAELAVQKIEKAKNVGARGTAPACSSDGSATLALTDGSVGSNPAAEPALAHASVGPGWQPLGFGTLLSKDQFLAWQRAVRAGVPAQAQLQFAEWQQRARGFAYAVPKHRSSGKHRSRRDRTRRKEKKERKERRVRESDPVDVHPAEKRSRVPMVISASDL
eukprot:TRINITY_DN22728_c0_g1_i2.p1 TRINITY_DN22728_c0_g1~~TRINITY_DN22728_c0_g1_i2.p1  ORF type:complete len:512 (-),score=81.19 TRINITY_DN22728_c0_g1_i2:247-1782(-)